MKRIKRILVSDVGWIDCKNGNIEEFGIDEKWYRQGNTEYNNKYVIAVEFVENDYKKLNNECPF